MAYQSRPTGIQLNTLHTALSDICLGISEGNAYYVYDSRDFMDITNESKTLREIVDGRSPEQLHCVLIHLQSKYYKPSQGHQ